MEELKYVGKSLIREDVYDKARGKTKYTCDRRLVDMLYAKLVLSKKAHSNITIDTTKAMEVEGIVAVYTHADVPKVVYNPHSWSIVEGSKEDQYILSEKARYMGDHIALVVGTSKEAVEEGVSLVEVTYEELPPVIGLTAAKEDPAQLAFDKVVAFGDYEKSKKEADFIVKTKGSTQKIHHSAIEPHIALSEVDESGNLVLWTPCQTVYQVQYNICHLLDLPYPKVRIIKAMMGGSFGGKGQSVVEPACAFAAWKLQRAVMLYMDRPDDILATRSRNAVEMEVQTAVTKEGRILGRNIECAIDGGAYYTNALAIVMALGKKLFRMYHMDSQTYHGTSYYTNTIPGGACRGYGSPQAHAITEINLDQVANVLGMDPCEFRLKNVVKPMDADPTGGTNLGNAQIEACIQKGMEAFDWKEKRKTIRSKNTKRYAYGVGMAAGAHGNGYKGAYPDFTKVNMVLYPDGTVMVCIGVHEQGCGTIMTMQQIAAEALHMDLYHIHIKEADTFITPHDSAGTQASRVTFVCGGAVQKAGMLLLEKLKDSCVDLYGWEKEEIVMEDGIAFYKNESRSYGMISYDMEKQRSCYMEVDLAYESPSNPASYAAAFVEVKVDRYTGQTEILDCLAVHDIGQAMNQMLAEGQISGGAHMSLGMALFEEIAIDGKGSVKSQNFSKYHIINAPDMPKVRSILIEAKEPDGPYGGKSVGELAAVAPAPAVVNAINFALGSQFADYPITPEKVVAYVEEKEKQEEEE